MLENIGRKFKVMLSLVIVVGGFSLLLNRASFDPNFSLLDAVSSATKRVHHQGKQPEDSWEYTREDLALENGDNFQEEEICVENISYRVLCNKKRRGTSETSLLLLSNKENREYQEAVRLVAEYYTQAGYNVQIKECSEIMMLSMAHAERFDIFLMKEEGHLEKME